MIHSIAGITAAGTLMVGEAGGKLTDLDGGTFDFTRENALATNGKVHSAMFRILKNGPNEERWKRIRPLIRGRPHRLGAAHSFSPINGNDASRPRECVPWAS